jgi:hypothetical protein
MAADKKITQLDLAPSLALNDVMPMVDVTGDITYKFTFEQLIAFLGLNVASGANISFGTALPSNTSGKDGDLFVKTDSNQFAQRISGVWTVVYTITPGVIGNVINFGTVAPTNQATGNANDLYIDKVAGNFYQLQIISGVKTWVLQFSMAEGPLGPRGNSILNGTSNPLSTDGLNGDFWLNTTTSVLFGPKSGGVWPSTGLSLVPIQPTQLLNGAVPPDNTTTGINGDFYINTTNYNIYGPKTGGVWPAGVALGGTGAGLNPGTFSVPAGSAIPYVFNYASGSSAYGNLPGIDVLMTDPSDGTGNTKYQVYDVKVQRILVSGTLTTLKVWGHDSGDGLHTIDDLTIVIRPTQ